MSKPDPTGRPALGRSPITVADFALMQRTAAFGEADVAALRRSHDILAPQVEAILDVWYGFVGSEPHLLASFSTPQGAPIGEYLAAVRVRFGRWIVDTARAVYDQAWLDLQHEIGLRHHRIKKNRTDGVDSTALVAFRHLGLLTVPIVSTLRPFLARGGADDADVDAMHAAWLKSCLLQVTLWSHPYVHPGDF
jgi:hypothetical protein